MTNQVTENRREDRLRRMAERQGYTLAKWLFAVDGEGRRVVAL